MLAKITLYDGTVYKIASQTVDTQDGIYLGRIKDELSLVSAMQEAGNAPNTVSLTIINYDNFIPHNKDLWAAEVLLTNENNISWRGKINFCNFDSDGNLYVTASEKTAPELELQLPDEVRQVYTVDQDFHQSSVTMTIPLVIGGTSSNPITLPTILIDKTRGIYLICVGEIRSVVNVYNGAEQLPQTAYTAYTGTADQEENAGFAYVQIAEDYRLNSDGSYAEINVDVVGLKLANFTEEECRNGALFLYYFLTTADTGVNGWGCGIDSSLIDTDSFQSAITLCNQLGYKLDGIMWLRQSAQSWIDQICQAIHGKYSINANGKRSLFIDYAGNASKKTFTASNMQVERYGKNSYTSVVYNKGVLSYDYNPITGLFMQSAQYENSDSIAQIGEQKFIGESYLIKDATTALAVLEYTCKRSQIAAEAIEFKTDDVETNLRAGDIITINRPDLNLNNALYQIQSISTTDFISSIIAVKFDTSVFSVTGTASTVNWGNERDITPALTPAQATNLLLSTGFDINPDGTGIPYISGTFTVPDGGWLAAAVQYGIGTNPSNWTEMALITEGRFKLSPVNVDTVYSIRVRMITATGHSSFITGVITATGDTIPPSKPTISAKATDKTVTIQCGLDTPPADMGGFQIYRKKSTDSESAYTYIGSIAANRGYAAFSDYVDEYVTYNYKAKSYDRSGNLSTQFSDVANVAVTGIEAVELAASAIAMPTGSILRLSAKNCTTESIAEVNGVKDVSGRGHHGRAYGGVTVLDGGEGFSFDGTGRINLPQRDYLSGLTKLSISARFLITQKDNTTRYITMLGTGTGADSFNQIAFQIESGGLFSFGGRGVSTDSIALAKTEVSENVEYHAVGTVDFTTKEIILYINGVAVATETLVSTGSLVTPNVWNIGANRSNSNGWKGYIKDLRIYPFVLTPTQVKSIYMLPDEAVFAQLTTDMFSANIIKANYILNDGDFQTLAIDAVNANINNLNVAGNATFTGLSNKVTAKYGTCSTGASTAAKVVDLDNFALYTGAQISVKFTNTNSVANPTLNVEGTGAKTIRAKGANLTASSLYNWVANDVVDFVYDGTYWVISDISAKDYSNTELAKKMSIASYCASSDTTKIDGANIYAGSVTALQMAANTITAEKLNVEAVRIPKGESFYVTANGLPNPMSAGSAVPDLTNYYSGKTYNGVLGHSTVRDIAGGGGGDAFRWSDLTYKTIIAFSGSGLTIGNSFTISLWIYVEDFSQNPCFLDIQNTTFGTNNNSSRIWVGANDNNGNGTLRFLIYNGTTAVELNSGTINKNTWYHLVFRLNSGTGICFRNGVSFGSSKTMTHSDLTANCITIGGFINNPSSRAFKGYIGEVKIFRRSLTEQEIMSLFHNGLDSESGQITADRLAVNAIRGRDASGGGDGSYTTQGIVMNLSGKGWLSTQKCSISSSGVIKAVDVDLTGKITATSGSFTGAVTATSGKIGNLSIVDGYLYNENTNITAEVGVKLKGIEKVTSSISNYCTIQLWPGGLYGDSRTSSYSGNTIASFIIDSTINGTGIASTLSLFGGATAYCANGWSSSCDESAKKDIRDVTALEKLKEIRVKKYKYSKKALDEKAWRYKQALKAEENLKKGIKTEEEPMPEFEDDENAPDYIMAMAGEFNKAFGVDNGNEESINYTNAIGVALRSIQELAEIVDSQKAEIAELKDLLKNSKDNDSEKELIEPSFDELLEDNENKK